MRWKAILGLLFALLVLVLLVIYWFVPLDSSEFFVKSTSANFSLSNNTDMQFYPNMRFPNPEISYKIGACTLQKKEDMERAFDMLAEATALSFYPVSLNEGVSISCDSKNKVEGGLFIAGEGGPTNISQAGEFNVIFHGTILLIKDSSCTNPNVALHELLHVLGFKHSENRNNIMYNISKCKQTMGEDIVNLINDLYSLPSQPDLLFENVSAKMNGRYLNTNLTVRNYGLKDAEGSQVRIYADGKLIKEVDINPIDVGYGRSISLSNVFVSQLNVEELDFEIYAAFQELNKENNKIKLQIKR